MGGAMIAWDYYIDDVGFFDWEEIGNKGWELVAVDGNVAYFKRPQSGLIAEAGEEIEAHVNPEHVASLKEAFAYLERIP